MEKNKTGKYLKYAIGEIVLVVIGILIALQVSNWNETRKEQNKTEAILDEFEYELKLTILHANHDISNSIYFDSVIRRVLTNKVTRQDYIDNNNLRYLLNWRFTLNPKLDNLDKLLLKEEILTEKYKEILYDIDRFSFIRGREVDAMNSLRVSAEQNTDYMNLTFPWTRISDSLADENAYHYFLTDENYKNRLFNHWEKAMHYTYIISIYRVEMLQILSKLKIVREGYTASELEMLFKKLGQQPFEKIAKNENIADLVSEDQIGKSSLIANYTKDTLQIIFKNRRGDRKWSYETVPGEIFTLRPEDIDLYGDNLRILELYKNDVLIEKYKEVQYGYLILE